MWRIRTGRKRIAKRQLEVVQNGLRARFPDAFSIKVGKNGQRATFFGKANFRENPYLAGRWTRQVNRRWLSWPKRSC